MKTLLFTLLHFIRSFFRSRLSLQAENLALRHQLAAYQRLGKRPQLKPADRFLWSWLSCLWSGWKEALLIVQPATVIKWQKKRFRDYWRRLSSNGKPGRPKIPKELRKLIREISQANPLWGSPRILGELKKLGIEVAKSTVEKYRVRATKPPSRDLKAGETYFGKSAEMDQSGALTRSASGPVHDTGSALAANPNNAANIRQQQLAQLDATHQEQMADVGTQRGLNDQQRAARKQLLEKLNNTTKEFNQALTSEQMAQTWQKLNELLNQIQAPLAGS